MGAIKVGTDRPSLLSLERSHGGQDQLRRDYHRCHRDAAHLHGTVRHSFRCIAYGANIETSTHPEAVRRYGLEPFGYYLIASRLVPENNADLIVRGFERLHSNRVLAIAGDANYRSAFVDALKKTRDPRVRFLGHVGDSEDVKELHCNCYGYVHGHSVGGTNPALLKALGYGNLVLALDTPFNRQVMENHGILFEHDPDDLASKLQFVEDEPHVAERYRRQATERILEEYTWDHITDQYEDYFSRLVAGEKPALDRELGMYVPMQHVDAAAGVLTESLVSLALTSVQPFRSSLSQPGQVKSMAFVVESRHLEDIVVIAPKAYRDERGFFVEVYRADQFKELGLPAEFVQDNHSLSRQRCGSRIAFSMGATDGKANEGDSRNCLPCCCGYSQGVAYSGQVVWSGSICRKYEASVGSSWLCSGLLCAQ